MIDNSKVVKQSKSLIRFYDPYYRLNFRAKAEDIFLTNSPLKTNSQGIDIIAIIDAVAKRGGPLKAIQRMEEIALSLPYYDIFNIKKYCEYIRSLQYEEFKHFQISELSDDPFIQEHLLPSTNGMHNFDLDAEQLVFVKQNFETMDEYLTIKTLAYFGAILSKLDSRYLQKYLKLRQWLFLHDLLIMPTQPQLKLFRNINNLTQSKVCIIGLNIPNIILALKLAALGQRVKLCDYSLQNIKKWESGFAPDIIKQGIFISNQIQATKINQLLSTYMDLSIKNLQNSQLSQPQRNDGSLRNRRQYESSDNFNKHESYLFILMQQTLSDYPNNNKKLLWPQIYHRAVNSNNCLDPRTKLQPIINERIDLQILQVHFQRFSTQNKLKDDATLTVYDIRKYLNSYYAVPNQTVGSNKIPLRQSKVKMALEHNAFTIHYQKLKPQMYEHLFNKKLSNLQICIDAVFKSMQFTDNVWKVSMNHLENDAEMAQQFSHVVYSNEVQIQRALRQAGHPLAQIKGECFDTGFAIFQQVVEFSEVHCLYRFRQRVSFKNTINIKYDNSNYSYVSCSLGLVHFYILASGQDVLAVVRRNQKSNNVDYYKQILVVLSNALKKQYKVDLPPENSVQLVEISRTFGIKDERFIYNLIKLRQQQRLYVSLPLITGESSRNILQAQMKVNSKIVQQIIKGATLRQSNQDRQSRFRYAVNEYCQQMGVDLSKCSRLYLRSEAVGAVSYDHEDKLKEAIWAHDQDRDGCIDRANEMRQEKDKDKDGDKDKDKDRDGDREQDGIGQDRKRDNDKEEQKQKYRNAEEGIMMDERQQDRHRTIQAQIERRADLFGLNSPIVSHYLRTIEQNIKHTGASMGSTWVRPVGQMHISNAIVVNGGSRAEEQVHLVSFGRYRQCGSSVVLQNYTSYRVGAGGVHYQLCVVVDQLPFYCIMYVTPNTNTNMNTNTGQIQIGAHVIFHTNLSTLHNIVANRHNDDDNNSMSMQDMQNVVSAVGSHLGLLPQLLQHTINEHIRQAGTHIQQQQYTKLQYYELLCNHIATTMHIGIDLQRIEHNIVDYIIKQAEQYLHYHANLYGFTTYSLADALLGKLTGPYIAAEMEGTFDQHHPVHDTLNTSDDGDSSEYARITQYLHGTKNTSKYALYITSTQQPSTITITRTFPNMPNPYTHTTTNMHELNPYVRMSGNSAIGLTSWVASTLSARHKHTGSVAAVVVEQLKDMIRQDMYCALEIYNLRYSPEHGCRKLSEYLRMTRMQPACTSNMATSTESRLAVDELCHKQDRECSTQWNKLYAMIDQSDLYVGNHQFICAIK